MSEGTIQEWIEGFRLEMRKQFDAEIKVQVILKSDIEQTMRKITSVVSECSGIHYENLISKKRGDMFTSDARMVAMYLIKKITAVSTVRIAMFFAARNHASAFHAINRVDDLIKINDPRITQLIEAAQQKLQQINNNKTNPQ